MNSTQPDIERILGLTVPVSVTLAERDLTIESILDVKVGTIIEFDVPFDADLVLNAANHPIGTGQAVKVGENFGLRVTKLADVHGRIEAMGEGKHPPTGTSGDQKSVPRLTADS